jgi:hypothetical protein
MTLRIIERILHAIIDSLIVAHDWIEEEQFKESLENPCGWLKSDGKACGLKGFGVLGGDWLCADHIAEIMRSRDRQRSLRGGDRDAR